MKTMRTQATVRAMRAIGLGAVALGALVYAAGCGVAVSQGPGVDLNPTFEINDEDIRKAFRARPQLPEQVRVAYFSVDPKLDRALEAELGSIPNVSDVVPIPRLMVTGERRYEDHRRHYRRSEAKAMSIKRLRLLAARHHCDAIVVVDTGNRSETQANGWVWTTPLLVPVFFAPFLDETTETYLDVYVIDTRNGYLYGHIQTEEVTETEWITIYESGLPDVQKRQIQALVKRLPTTLDGMFKRARRADAPTEARSAAPKATPKSEPAAAPEAPTRPERPRSGGVTVID